MPLNIVTRTLLALAGLLDLVPAQTLALAQTVVSSRDFATAPHPNDAPDIAAAKSEWLQERQKIIDYLNHHLPATIETLNSVVPQPDGNYSVTARLDDHTYLISETRRAGVFIAAARDGKYRVVWDLDLPVDVELQCEDNGGEPDAPVMALPDTAEGDHRFYVMTTICHGAGVEETSILEIFRWHDGNAIRELSGQFDHNADSQSYFPALRGSTLHVATDGADKVFLDDAYTLEHYDWKIRLGATAVTDLGRTPLEPERILVDRLFDRIARAKNADALAAAPVISTVKESIAPLLEDSRRRHIPFFVWLSDWSVKRVRQKSAICVVINESANGDDPKLERGFAFTLADQGRLFVSNVKLLASGERCHAS